MSSTIRTVNWSLFVEKDDLKIFQHYVGTIRFGPDYIHLKSEPEILWLVNKLFGDWFYLTSNGIYLQEWKSIREANTNLIFIHRETLLVEIIKEHIPSVLWNIRKVDGTLELLYEVGNKSKSFRIQ